MFMLSNVREQWFSNIRGDVLAGLVVGLALIPEAIAFSIIAGVDPKVGLYASFCIAVVISFVGGRPASFWTAQHVNFGASSDNPNTSSSQISICNSAFLLTVLQVKIPTDQNFKKC